MKTELSWIEGGWHGRLAISPRPRGGDWLEDEVRGWRSANVDVVVSLLTSDEAADLDLTREGQLCQADGMEFLSFPIMDRGVPASTKDALEFVRKLEKRLLGGKNVSIHCRQGIGRSALMAACLLVLSGFQPAVAFERVSAARGCVVPETAEQQRWVVEFAREFAAVSATD